MYLRNNLVFEKGRGEAFAIICHKCIHTQTSKCFAPTLRGKHRLLEFFKKLDCYLLSDNPQGFAPVLSPGKNRKKLAFFFIFVLSSFLKKKQFPTILSQELKDQIFLIDNACKRKRFDPYNYIQDTDNRTLDTNCESLWKKMIGKPYSRKLNVRFDEGELEIEHG